LINILLLKI